MAAVSLSPPPISTSSYPSTMSSRRAPLSSNPNAANSPMRTRPSASLASVLDKHRQQTSKRAHASVQREEPYGQQPPIKRQLLNDGSKEAIRAPAVIRRVKVGVPNSNHQARKDSKPSQSTASKAAQQEEEVLRMRRWKDSTRSNFPDFVFYFESAPDDKRSKWAKQIAQLGGREEKFFSKNITHVITARSLPTDRPTRTQSENAPVSGQAQNGQPMPRTIDPALLSRDHNIKDVRRRLLESGRKRVPPPVLEESSAPRPPTVARNTDILVRAHEMKMKIWPCSKLQRVLQVMFDSDPLRLEIVNAIKSGFNSVSQELAQLLNKERVNGPSDRDPTVSTKELNYFKGPYIYIYDIEEKQKPIMVREYAKVADTKDGDWPQFRATKDGRCPFVEEDAQERQRRLDNLAHEKERQARRERALAQTAPELKPPPPPPLGRPISRPTATKRSLSEMQERALRAGDHNRVSEVFDLAKANNPPSLEFNAFKSRAKTGRLHGGEPVASGIQPSNITSAIQSQMISSAAGVLGAKAGTSKEMHGLQRKVLEKWPMQAKPQARRMSVRPNEMGNAQRSASLSVGFRMPGEIEEERIKDHKRTKSVPFAVPPKPKKRDLKPGYCENCQDKFDDFDQHILVKKHRKFAEDPSNWSGLDDLLSQLDRSPKYIDIDDDTSTGSPEV